MITLIEKYQYFMQKLEVHHNFASGSWTVGLHYKLQISLFKKSDYLNFFLTNGIIINGIFVYEENSLQQTM